MSEPVTRPIHVAPGSSGEAPGADAQVLARAEGVELLGEVPGSGYRRPPALARRGDGQVIQLTPLLQQVLAAVDGRRTVEQVAERVGTATGRLVRPDDVRQLVDTSLRPLGLLRRADGGEPELRRSDPLLALRFRRAVTDPDVTRRVTAPFAVLFTPLLVLPVVLAFVAVAGWVLFREGLAAATAQAFANPALFLTVVAVTVLSAGFHEFGHAAAARYGGATPGVMGFGVYLFWPAFYTDVTDSYRLGRGGRVRTDLGGLYFNALVVLAVFAVWWVTGWHAVLLIVATQVLQMIRQLAPLLRFDGYHVLADVTGVPDLYQRIGPVLASLVPGRRSPEAQALKTWARVVVTVWVLVVVPLMAAALLLMVIALPRLLATAWAGVQAEADRLGAAVGDGDVLGVLARALGIVALAVPVLGIGYVLLRLARRTVTGVRTRTEGRPARRALAVAVAAALVAGLAWAWWPDGENYRPVRPWEGGTVLDAVPAASSETLTAGREAAAVTIWPEDGGPLPTADTPALAMVLVPAGTTGEGPDAGTPDAPAWVFPFDRPAPPEEGDNQALAVNTEDGSVLYDVAFALVWADDGDAVLNRNEAYAFASCQDCRTVAVAFQVILVVGSVDVVVPENVAVAANFACLECVTHALATQLVVTLPGELSAEADAELAEIWAELQEFGRQLAGLPLSELRARLTEFEQRILAVVEDQAAPAPTDGSGTEDAAEEEAERTGGGDGATDPDGGGATAPTGTAARSSSGATGGSTATPTTTAPGSSSPPAPSTSSASDTSTASPTG
jgi:putative peptide zinc metalloprotease protein